MGSFARLGQWSGATLGCRHAECPRRLQSALGVSAALFFVDLFFKQTRA